MKCSSCAKNVKDGTAICPHCDAILDESILGDIPGGGGDDDTPAPEVEAAPPPAPKRAAAKPAAKPAAARKPLKPAPVPTRDPEEAAPPAPAAGGQGGYVNKYAQYWEESDEEKAEKEKRAKQQEAEAPKRRAPAPNANAGGSMTAGLSPSEGGDAGTGMEGVDEMLQSVKTAFQSLVFEDKLVVVAALGLAFMSVMPWWSNAEDMTLGVTTWGFFTFLLAGTVIFGTWSKSTNRLPMVPEKIWPFLPMGAGALTACIAIIFSLATIERTKVNGVTQITGSASFGAYLSLAFGGGLVLGGFLLMKKRKA